MSASRTTDTEFPDLYEANVMDLQEGLDAAHFSSVDLIKAYFSRIEEVNINGPGLRAVLEINPSALAQAAELDAERKSSGKRSQLHGIPVLLKDNIATVASEGMNTTAGSYSLLGSVPPEDADVVKRLRAAGAIMLGKANLSEFSYFRGAWKELPGGWSARGGQSKTAYHPNGTPCGSSSGSAIAASIGLAAVTLGTETHGSIISPASKNNVVGIKPTVGLTSRSGVIPVTIAQDSIGPITRCVADAAIVLSVIAGRDPADDASLAQPDPVPDYTRALSRDALRGKRIGVPRHVYMDQEVTDADPAVIDAFAAALDVLRSQGAEVVDPADIPSAGEIQDLAWEHEGLVFVVDGKLGINEYLGWLEESPTGVSSLGDIIKFNNDHPELEKPPGLEGQGRLLYAEKTSGRDERYHAALKFNHEVGRARGIDAALKNHNLDALVLPSIPSSYQPAAIAGYPIITVPLGFYPENTEIKLDNDSTTLPFDRAPGMPFGISFIGTAYSEFDLIGIAYAFEQATQARLKKLAYPEAIPKTQLSDIKRDE